MSTGSTESTYHEIAANGALALIAVARSLLSRQLDSLEKAFLEKGGFTERLYRVRSQRRSHTWPTRSLPSIRPITKMPLAPF